MKVLLVDLDDTLLDYSGGVDQCWLDACAAVASPAGIDPATLVPAIARARSWFWSDPDRHRRERIQMLAAWRKITAQALDDIGAGDLRLAAAIAEDFADRRWACMTLLPGARQALEEFKRRRVPLALVTNGDASHQRRKVAEHRLGEFFDVILIEGEFGFGKPDESVYRHVLATLGVKPSDAWMVGDHLEWDVAAPKRLGLGGIWVDAAGQGLPDQSPCIPDRIVSSFADVLDSEGGIAPLPTPPPRNRLRGQSPRSKWNTDRGRS